jgi:hypothetical protein
VSNPLISLKRDYFGSRRRGGILLSERSSYIFPMRTRPPMAVFRIGTVIAPLPKQISLFEVIEPVP